MLTQPPKPCRHPQCSNLNVKSYRPQHSKSHGKQRGYARERGYDSKWKAIRKRYLIAYPLCFECLKTGALEPATEVHHTVTLRDGGSSDYRMVLL